MPELKETRATYLTETFTIPRVTVHLPSGLIWLKHLSNKDQTMFSRELMETVLLAGTQGKWDTVAQLLDDWQATAEICADPELHAVLTEPVSKQELVPWEQVRASLLSQQPAPEVYVDALPGGMSFEIPEAYISDFLTILARYLPAQHISLSFREDGHYRELEYSAHTLADGLPQVANHLTDPSLVVEFDDATLYTGGGGCFSLAAELSPERQAEIGNAILQACGVTLYLPQKPFAVILRDGKAEVLA